jgi:hypothetical protein
LTVNHYHLARTTLGSNRSSVNSKSTSTLNYDSVTECDTDSFESEQYLCKCTVHCRDGLAWKLVGNFVSIVTRLKIEVLGHSAIAVVVLVESNHVASGSEFARVVFTSDAVVATVAWEEERERYAVALF